MRIGVFIFLAGITTAGAAKAADPDVRTWSEGLLARLPFQHGVLDRDGYGVFTNSFVADKKLYFANVFENLANTARQHGWVSREDTLRRDHERRIKELDISVNLATESLFAALDTDGDGMIHRSEARSILHSLAVSADLDNNGLLDRDEQRLAEWSLGTGQAIAEKSDVYGLRRQFIEMERVEGW